MYSELKVQYLTNEKGIKKAVQVPYHQWEGFLNEYKKLKQYYLLRNEIKEGLEELKDAVQGIGKEVTLSEFLNEN